MYGTGDTLLEIRFWYLPKCISSTVHQNQILKIAKFIKKSIKKLGTLKYMGILAFKKVYFLTRNSKFEKVISSMEPQIFKV